MVDNGRIRKTEWEARNTENDGKKYRQNDKRMKNNGRINTKKTIEW